MEKYLSRAEQIQRLDQNSICGIQLTVEGQVEGKSQISLLYAAIRA
jgi:hypothetical protein